MSSASATRIVGGSGVLAVLLLRLPGALAGSGCAAGSVQMVTLGGSPVCEDFSALNGSLLLPGLEQPLRKRLYAQHAKPTFGNASLAELNNADDDMLGKALLRLAAAERRDVSFDEVLAALPPIMSGWGAKPNFGYAGQHTFTGSREASVDLVFDHKGDCGQWTGFPRPLTVVAEPLDDGNIFEGLLGGELPILVWVFPVKGNGSAAASPEQVAAGCRWEMTVAPIADVDHNHEQPAFFRFVRLCGAELSGTPLYFDTNIYTPDYRPPAEAFYEAVRGQRQYWSATWAAEGTVELSLPNAGGTDGGLLRDQALHSLLRDMITRVDTWFPRYGVCGGAGGCAYGDPHNNGFQEIFTASLAGSLELGAHVYAQGVLENYLRYYLKERGTIAYRGLEMAQSGRMLTLFAQYWRYTRDSETLLKYFDKIQGIVTLLSGRREQATAAHPAGSVLRGMPIGHDEADLFVTWAQENAGGNHSTELPFFSIGAEFWRGLNDLGQAWEEIGKLNSNATVAAAGRAMLAAAPPLLADIEASMAATHAAAAAVDVNNTRCWPYVAGRTQCAELKTQSSDRDSEPWRTYAEMAWSGISLKHGSWLEDMIAWNREYAKSMKGGMLSGTGSDASGNNLMTFTGIGWGYGLLLADDIPTFILQLFTAAAHANTRGTWTAPEEADIGGGAMPYASSSQLLMPVNLRWALLWEHPHTGDLWLARATPRAWLSEGERISISGAPSSHGRVSYTLSGEIGSKSCVGANATIALHSAAAGATGAAVLRLRTPGRRDIASVQMAVGNDGPKQLPPSSWNTTDESVRFALADLGRGVLARVCYKSDDETSPDERIDCLWTVNQHQHAQLFDGLAPSLRGGLSDKTTSVYPGTSRGGFIGYPTELLTLLPAVSDAVDTTSIAAGSCGKVLNDTGSYESSYTHVAADSLEACCSKCAADSKCSFALHQPTNPVLTHRCWLVAAKTMTPRAERGTQLVAVAGRPAPPPPPPVYWLDAWTHNLQAYPQAMKETVMSGLNGTSEGLLMVDFEPEWRPSWRCLHPDGISQPRWAAMLATIHAKQIDTNMTSLVGWAAPAGAANWAALTSQQQVDLQHAAWDYFCRQYLTAALRAVKAALPAKVELSFWNWPFKFGKTGKPADWDDTMDELGWLWAELPIFMPDLYPEFYSGTPGSLPADLSTCTAENQSSTLACKIVMLSRIACCPSR